MNVFHGTSKKNIKGIMGFGFKKSYGRFGKGIYFTSNLSEALKFGDVILNISLDMSNILTLEYLDLKNTYPYLQTDEEEGVTELEILVRQKQYAGVRIIYPDKTDEICIYEQEVIIY